MTIELHGQLIPKKLYGKLNIIASAMEVSLMAITVTPTAAGQVIEVPDGYDGFGTITSPPDEDFIPNNIRFGKTVFGVEGAYTGSLAFAGVASGHIVEYDHRQALSVCDLSLVNSTSTAVKEE